jgi:hypothetical protein
VLTDQASGGKIPSLAYFFEQLTRTTKGNMPNHCHNDLYIQGSAENVSKLLAHIGADKETPEFDFNSVIPYPEEFSKMDDDLSALGFEAFREKYGPDALDGYNSGGYQWCNKNWGTKWNAYQVVRRDYGGVCLTFQTAWSPATLVVVALHKLFPECNLHLEFYERGAAYAGGLSLMSESDWYEDGKWEPGTITREWEADYKGHRGG